MKISNDYLDEVGKELKSSANLSKLKSVKKKKIHSDFKSIVLWTERFKVIYINFDSIRLLFFFNLCYPISYGGVDLLNYFERVL